jgi:uncharacterized protein with PQ loop repeat
MINMIELLGWISTALTIMSFIPKGETKIRLINGIACILWIVYGVLLKQNPIIVVNGLVLILHIIYFIRLNKKKTYINDYTYTPLDKRNEVVDPDFMYKWIKSKSGK